MLVRRKASLTRFKSLTPEKFSGHRTPMTNYANLCDTRKYTIAFKCPKVLPSASVIMDRFTERASFSIFDMDFIVS